MSGEFSNGNRLTNVLLLVTISVLGFLALQVWNMNASIAAIKSNRFTAQDALDHERLENLRFDAVSARVRQLEIAIAQYHGDRP